MTKYNTIDVLGTRYTIYFANSDEFPYLNDSFGFCDWSTKQIILDESLNNDMRDEFPEQIANLKIFRNKVLRHEIIHAFVHESGLNNTMHEWADNEESVDWFAQQAPKIYQIYFQLQLI